MRNMKIGEVVVIAATPPDVRLKELQEEIEILNEKMEFKKADLKTKELMKLLRQNPELKND